MHSKGSGTPWAGEPWIAERAIILQVLRDDRDERWSRAEMQTEVFDVDPSAISDALERLEWHGVVVRYDDEYMASRCALHMDAIGMVSI
jgi:DNA-binding MarR family transcriptional regulator